MARWVRQSVGSPSLGQGLLKPLSARWHLVETGRDVYTPHPFCAGIAQLVERVIRNDEVVGSIPISGTIPQTGLTLTHISLRLKREGGEAAVCGESVSVGD